MVKTPSLPSVNAIWIASRSESLSTEERFEESSPWYENEWTTRESPGAIVRRSPWRKRSAASVGLRRIGR